MKLRALAATGLAAGCVAVALPATANAADSTSTPAPTPACGALPTYVEGRPAHLHARAATGDYLWHDSNGWHLRVTHPTKSRMVFRGVITASSPMTARRVRDEKHDKVTVITAGRRWCSGSSTTVASTASTSRTAARRR